MTDLYNLFMIDVFGPVRDFIVSDTPHWLNTTSCLITVIGLVPPLIVLTLRIVRVRRGSERAPITLAEIKDLVSNLRVRITPSEQQIDQSVTNDIPAGAIRRIGKKNIVKQIRFMDGNAINNNTVLIGELVFRMTSIALWITSYFYIIFDFIEVGFSDVVRDFIRGIFLVCLATILFKILEIKNNTKDTSRFCETYITNIGDFTKLNSIRFSSIRVARRSRLIKNNSDDLSCLHELLPAAASLDANEIETGYVSLSVYAWTLPVLGFIGTARGMAEAIGGFKRGIQDQENPLVSSLTQLLTHVIQGLSTAFDATIIALSATMVVYICLRCLKSVDQSNLDRLDGFCLDILSIIPLPNDVSFEHEIAEVVNRLEGITEQLRKLTQIPLDIDKITKDADRATAGVQGGAKAVLLASKAIGEASDAIRETATIASVAAKSIEAAGKAMSQGASRSITNQLNRFPFSYSWGQDHRNSTK